MQIRPAEPRDTQAILSIIVPAFRDGTTYAVDPAIADDDALAYWLGADKETFVAEEDGAVLGTYFVRANYSGGGNHVANCGYITSAGATGRGVARTMCQHSMERARARGFRAMQYNFVVSTNERAVRLWQSMGFAIVGRLPGAFRHPVHGDVDAFVMFRSLE
jgi:ribosomal protein S18 acetylase RimI-like enzyme